MKLFIFKFSVAGINENKPFSYIIKANKQVLLQSYKIFKTIPYKLTLLKKSINL